MTTPNTRMRTFVPIKEAMNVTGKADKTIRRKIERELAALPISKRKAVAKKDPRTGKWSISKKALEQWCKEWVGEGTVEPTNGHSPGASAVSDPKDRLVEFLRKQIDEKDRDLREAKAISNRQAKRIETLEDDRYNHLKDFTDRMMTAALESGNRDAANDTEQASNVIVVKPKGDAKSPEEGSAPTREPKKSRWQRFHSRHLPTLTRLMNS